MINYSGHTAANRDITRSSRGPLLKICAIHHMRGLHTELLLRKYKVTTGLGGALIRSLDGRRLEAKTCGYEALAAFASIKFEEERLLSTWVYRALLELMDRNDCIRFFAAS
tara:strand:- start:1270 stop:1602 length:333 start_codon:yes stop_codon:yes gene_type:complete